MLVFKTSAFNRSATSPKSRCRRSCERELCLELGDESTWSSQKFRKSGLKCGRLIWPPRHGLEKRQPQSIRPDYSGSAAAATIIAKLISAGSYRYPFNIIAATSCTAWLAEPSALRSRLLFSPTGSATRQDRAALERKSLWPQPRRIESCGGSRRPWHILRGCR